MTLIALELSVGEYNARQRVEDRRMGMLAALIRAGFGVKGKDNDPDKLIGLAGVIAKEQRAEAAAHAEAATREDAARFTLPDAAAEVRALPPEATGAQGDRGDDASGLG